jgi:hypothetical protein
MKTLILIFPGSIAFFEWNDLQRKKSFTEKQNKKINLISIAI